MRAILTAIAGLIVATLPLAERAAAASEDTIIVLDASGSMWEQINKEPRIAIARRVMADVVAQAPADRRLGVVAYGHRRAGDCADIEELAPVGSARAAVKAAVDRISPRGKTPMSAAVKFAAEKLQYTSKKATVVLISDGIETCAPDPCAAAAALEKAGADLKVHVVGLGVTAATEQAQLRCIAENTGGKFFAAQDSAALLAALRETVVAATPAPAAKNLSLRATELAGGPIVVAGLSWTVTPSAGGAPVFAQAGAGAIDVTAPPGTYDVAVVRAKDGLKGVEKGVAVRAGVAKTVTIALEFPLAASVKPDRATAVAGSTLKAVWTGPDRKGDFIAVAAPDEPAGSYLTWSATDRLSPTPIRAPLDAGTYEIRYVLGQPYRVLAKAPLTVTAATATLTAPDAVVAGDTFKVAFTGPTEQGDWITIVKPDEGPTKFGSYFNTREVNPGQLRAPVDAGAYEIRFVQGDKKVLARRALTVTAAGATLSAPDTVVAGATFKVAFTGPTGQGDWITVVRPDDPPTKYADYFNTKEANPGTIRAPLEPGAFEIRFVQADKKVIARRPLAVTAAAASLSAPATAFTGETVAVAFSGPAGQGDWVTVVKPDDAPTKYNDYFNATVASPGKVRMPLDPGTYEIRFVQGDRVVLARRPITVKQVAASLTAPSSAKAGSEIAVAFTGPGGQGDWITIVKPDEAPTRYTSYFNTSQPGQQKLKMPATPGAYELRFVQGDRKVIARRPITVTP